jgi:hypothetical protein
MKKIILTSMVFASVANVSAQLEIDMSGNAIFGGNIQLGSSASFTGTTGDIPITFKVTDFLSGYTGASGVENVSFGYKALFSNITNSRNTANGYSEDIPGDYNTAVGWEALSSNLSGLSNTAIGNTALFSNLSGFGNTANGTSALYSNENGDSNTASGILALSPNTTGYNNTAYGPATLFANTTGSDNTAIGAYADVNASNRTNATAIGAGALATANNQVKIGNEDVTSIGGYAAWTNLSDQRTKKNIRTDVPGLDFINRLQPVTYNLDLDALDGLLNHDEARKQAEDKLPQKLKNQSKKLREVATKNSEAKQKAREAKEKQLQSGFIAQDVEKAAKSIGYDFSGVDVDGNGIYGLRYAEFVVPLVKAAQELSEQNDRLQAQNDQMQAQINELTELVYGLLGKDANPALLKSKSANEAAAGGQGLAGSGASLQQNSPNPFGQTTVIRYTLPQTGSSAQLVVSSAAGRVVRQLPLQQGTDSITIEGGSLAVGIYYYSLYVDGSLVDTKKMILTK